ncbi:MAG: RNA polymerase sigma factor [Anaerolineales bacterium]
MDQPDALRLVDRCRSGEQEAVTRLVQTYQPTVYRLALSILDDASDADEATQETFLAALRSLADYRGQSGLRTWLFAIGLNICRSRLRQRHTRLHLHQLLQGAWLTGADPVAPESAVVQRQANDALWQAVQSLGERHRLPVILRYYHDLPVDEIAAVLGINAGTVHSRLSIARDRLRVALGSPAKVRSEAEPKWQP